VLQGRTPASFIHRTTVPHVGVEAEAIAIHSPGELLASAIFVLPLQSRLIPFFSLELQGTFEHAASHRPHHLAGERRRPKAPPPPHRRWSTMVSAAASLVA
jgi:hypothetical protein